MRKLLNTLYVLSSDAYLTLDGENIVVSIDKKETGRFPLHTLENVVSFSYAGASPALMGACARKDIGLCFLTPRGRFLARTSGEESGNVLLRRRQYDISKDEKLSCSIASHFILGKIYNSRWILERFTRDHPMRVPVDKLKNVSSCLASSIFKVKEIDSVDNLRGIEGEAAQLYFSRFDDLILQQKDDFFFRGRNRRPPLDNTNALLSLTYTILANDCANALRSVGLDPYVGFMHGIRPGRTSLALDIMEELRPVIADRFVLNCINKRVINESHFERQESGAVLLTKEGKNNFFKAWQERKQDTITHPFLKEKVHWGLVPYVQALLLARTIRGDLEEYPPFLWK